MEGKTVALAGIFATAVVGIAGTTSSWLIERDQRRVAHDARVYNRKADAELAALNFTHSMEVLVERAPGVPFRKIEAMSLRAHRSARGLYLRLTAFAPGGTVQDFTSVIRDWGSVAEDAAGLKHGRTPARRRAVLRRYEADVDDLGRSFARYEDDVRRDIG
jgi:hypothetical protein